MNYFEKFSKTGRFFLKTILFLSVFPAPYVYAEWFQPVDADAYLRKHGGGGSDSSGAEVVAPKKVKLLDDTPIQPPNYEKFVKLRAGNVAKFKILNRITDKVSEFSVTSGQPTIRASFKIAISDCRVKTYPDHSRITSADVYVDTVNIDPDKKDPVPEAKKPLYEKTMYMETPGINGFEHPVYDIWLTACKTLKPETAAEEPSLTTESAAEEPSSTTEPTAEAPEKSEMTTEKEPTAEIKEELEPQKVTPPNNDLPALEEIQIDSKSESPVY